MKNKLLLILVLVAIGVSSCRSGWSCKKRYVSTNPIVKPNC